MARLAFAGAEFKDTLSEGLSATGTVSIDSTGPRSGVGCFDFASGSASALFKVFTATTGRSYFARAWIYFSANPAADTDILAFGATTNYQEVATLTTAGKIKGTDGSTLSSVLSAGWHCVEIKVTFTSSTSWSSECRVDGTLLNTRASHNPAATLNRITFGNYNGTAHGITLRADDFALNDSTGAAQNDYPGTTEKILLALPVSDNAVGTDIKLGDGTSPSANAFDSVNNVPPVGVAQASATAGSQLRDVAASSTEPGSDADFNVQSYTTAGAPSGSTVTATQVISAFGVGSSSAARSFGVKSVSNPADGAEVTATSATAVGTYPTSWVALQGNITTAPTVTLGTQPVVRIGKRNVGTNNQYVAAIGLLFGYEPPSLVGSASALSGASGTVTGAAALHGTAASTSSGSGTVKGAAALHGTAAAAASGAGTLSNGVRPLTGSGSSTSGASGSLKGTAALQGSASAVASGAGTLSSGVLALTGAGAATSGATGSLKGAAALHGTAAAAASGSGGMAALVELVGTADAASDAWGFVHLDLPTRITGTFTDRWASGLHVGAAKPQLRVEVRSGRFNRRYAHWDDAGFSLDAIIGNSDPVRPWQAFWEPGEPYVEIPSVRSVELAKTFDEKGIATATIAIDNIAYLAETGGQHSIHRGYMSPLRGYVAAGRDRLTDERGDPVNENEWFDKLHRKRQITVHEAYGDQWVKTFTGLIDDVDDTSNPAVITITARSFGQVLSDEEFVGWNIDSALRPPVTFIDKDDADKITKGGYSPDASSTGSTGDTDYSAAMVDDGDSNTYWRSNDHTAAGNTEWVEIRVGEGRYEDFWLGTEYPDLDVYVSIYAKALADGSPPTRAGVALTPEAWVDTGTGTVPGTFGGEPYVSFISHSSAAVQVRNLDASYELGRDSIIRVSFRNLYDLGAEGFRAAVRSLYSRKRTLVAEPGAAHWIRVGDISDVVKVVLRWAGYKEWEVESTGARLGKRLLANSGMKYMDLIDKIKDGVGFEFFVGDPTSADESIGVPVFRKGHVVATGIDPVFTVTDGSDPSDGKPHLLTSVQVQETDEPLAYIIRTRGRTAKNGETFGADTTKRIMYVYRPPWSGEESAGVIRHLVHTDELYTTVDDVKFAAWFLALEGALSSVSVAVQIPGFPGIDLDDIFVLEDLGTGLTTRLSVRERRSTNTVGEDASWVMTLGGAITDTPDVQEIVALIQAARRD